MDNRTFFEARCRMWGLLLLVLSGIGAIAAFVTGPGPYYGGIWLYRWGFVGMCGLAGLMLLMLKIVAGPAPRK